MKILRGGNNVMPRVGWTHISLKPIRMRWYGKWEYSNLPSRANPSPKWNIGNNFMTASLRASKLPKWKEKLIYNKENLQVNHRCRLVPLWILLLVRTTVSCDQITKMHRKTKNIKWYAEFALCFISLSSIYSWLWRHIIQW